MKRFRRAAPAALLAAALAGCGGAPQEPGAAGDAPADLDSIADAVPRYEPLSATGNAPYSVEGVRYHPLATADGFVQRGLASWYGEYFHGRDTSSGERYDMYAMSAAHQLLPLPSYARVTSLDTGRSVVVRINDRGPFVHGRIIDLSYAAAHKLGTLHEGLARVEVRVLQPDGASVRDALAADAGDAEAAAPASGILVQIGAYALRDNASALREKMLQEGYRVAELAPVSEDAGTLYRVHVGPYAAHAEAQTALRELEALLGWAGTLVEE